MNIKNLIVLDTETCSLKGGILELAWAAFPTMEKLLTSTKENFIETSYQQYFKNPIPIDPFAFDVHGITEKSVENCPLYDVKTHFYLPILEKLFACDYSETLLIGHNINTFDIRVAELSKDHPTIDTMKLAEFLIKEKILTHDGGKKLDLLCSIYCSKDQAHINQFHGAMQDNWKVILFLQALKAKYLPDAGLEEFMVLSDHTLSPNIRKKYLKQARISLGE